MLAAQRPRHEGGQGLTEYALIVGLIALLMIAMLQVVGRRTGNAFCSVSNGLSGAGALAGWGYNGVGQLGNGKADSNVHASPASVQGLCVTAIAASGGGSYGAGPIAAVMALKSDGTVLSWGSNYQGQLGVGDSNPRYTPTQVVGGTQGGTNLSNIAAVTGGSTSGAAIDTGGHVWSWGDNQYGELGQGNVDGLAHLSPAQVVAGADSACGVSSAPLCNIKSMSLSVTGLAVDGNGNVWSWGYNNCGQLGIGTSGASQGSPVEVLTGAQGDPSGHLSHIVQVVAGGQQSWALDSFGHVWGWGCDAVYYGAGGGSLNVGEVGVGTASAVYTTPMEVLNGAADTDCTTYLCNVRQISIAAAVDKSGHVWTWGDNDYGMLGQNLPADSAYHGLGPVVTSSGAALAGITSVSVGGDGMALKSDGTVWAWGYNAFGEMGNGASGGTACDPAVLNLGNNCVVYAGQVNITNARAITAGAFYASFATTLQPVS